MERHQHPQAASETAEQLALLGRELGQIARTLRFRCQLAGIPLASDFELTYRCEDGGVTVCGSRLHVELARTGARSCAR